MNLMPQEVEYTLASKVPRISKLNEAWYVLAGSLKE